MGRQAGKRIKLEGIALDYAGKLKIVIKVYGLTEKYCVLSLDYGGFDSLASLATGILFV
ncbi:hypothetical protein [Neobacillus sp. CF12]|uniref:hypothetical protein n=1 Tax=Neobacillus sp. CF12 TaxID=3055864 RepID=UPI0025A136B1|nr:hypothetical protein [Neobacillus sp. CF12]MDM5329717.1 hypothetical protein [Neobacillus sp. CF12]